MIVRTVLGDIPPSALGVTNSHDHLFFRTPLLPGQQLDDVHLATAEAQAFAAAGGAAIIQWTPRGLGRQHDDLATIARTTNLHIVSATGRHRGALYGLDPTTATPSVTDLAGNFVADLNRASPSGIIKIGTGYWHLDPFERDSLAAAAQAHHATGAPIAVHLEAGTAGDLVLDILTSHNVEPTAVVLGHLGRNPEDGYLRDVAGSGAFLCFDGPSRANHPTDWRTPACLLMLAEHGHVGQLLIGGDTTTAAARSVTAGPGMSALLNGFGRRLRPLLGDPAWHSITVGNPARAFAFRPTA